MTGDNFRFRECIFFLYRSGRDIVRLRADAWGICSENTSSASFSRGIKYNWQIKAEDLTSREIKTDGVPRALLRREREKRAADAFFVSPHLSLIFIKNCQRTAAKINWIYTVFAVNVLLSRRMETPRVFAIKLLTS